MFGRPMPLAAVIAAASLIVLTFGCTGSRSGPGDPLLDKNPPPGIVGDISAPPAPGDFPVAHAPEGVSADAPLGTNPAYDVQPAGADEVSHQAAKAASQITNGLSFQIQDMTIAASGGDPDWNASNLSFAEGTAVDLWMKYEANANAQFARGWIISECGLSYSEPQTTAPAHEVYTVRFSFLIPYDTVPDGETSRDATFTASLMPPRITSAVIIGDGGDNQGFPFTITSTATSAPVEYPVQQSNDGSSSPYWPTISVTWPTPTSIEATSSKNLSNVVLLFEDWTREKFTDLTGSTATFAGTGANAGKEIVGVWVHSGNNSSGDGPGYGQYFPLSPEWRYATMAWEDLLVNSDYDYNDMVASMHATETLNDAGSLVELDLTVKAQARGAGYAADWQFNVDAAFPGASVVAIVDQYYANGTAHGAQRVWRSLDGASVPVFAPTISALPPPPGTFATNTVKGTTFVNGDYATVTIILNTPMAAGSYTPAPYEPELLVTTSGGDVYTIRLWRKPGDWVDSHGRPLAFIVPAMFAWPLERHAIWNAYSGFNTWVNWVKNYPSLTEPNPAWYFLSPTVADSFDWTNFNS